MQEPQDMFVAEFEQSTAYAVLYGRRYLREAGETYVVERAERPDGRQIIIRPSIDVVATEDGVGTIAQLQAVARDVVARNP